MCPSPATTFLIAIVHVVGRLNAIIGPLGEAPGYQLFQFGGESCAGRVHLCWLIAKHRGQDLGRAVAGKSTTASRHFVEDAAQREDVAALIGDGAAGLLRGHVAHGAHDPAGFGEVIRCRSPEARHWRTAPGQNRGS